MYWSASLFLLDQLLKYLSVTGVFRYHKNLGISFGLFPNFAWVSIFLYILAFWFLFGRIKNRKNKLNVLALSIFAACGLSNSLDRLTYGGVIDYLPILGYFFNLSDIGLIASLFLLGYDVFVSKSTVKNSVNN